MGTLRRLVENQEQKVTLRLTDNLAQHDVLEGLLEESKPDGIEHTGLGRFDYLLRTPWRYPPLKWGSRFGRRFEPSLFYGALDRSALFAEAAYYRLVFLEGMKKPFGERVISQFTVSKRCIERGRDWTCRSARSGSTRKSCAIAATTGLARRWAVFCGSETLKPSSTCPPERSMTGSTLACFRPRRYAHANTAIPGTGSAKRAHRKSVFAWMTRL